MKKNNNRGSVLVIAAILTAVMLLIVGGLLRLAVVEKKANTSMAYWVEARMAAEAVAENAAAQVRSLYMNQNNPLLGAHTFSLPPASAFAGGNVNYSSLECKVQSTPTSIVTPGLPGLYYYDPADPNSSKNDPATTNRVMRRDVIIVAKATVVPPNFTYRPITAYVQETISIRGNNLLDKAIFYYSGDLELFPGPSMHVYGAVHTNKNLYVSNQSGNSLNFHSPVSVAGYVFHAWASSVSSAQGAGSETLGQAPVNFMKADNSGLTNMNLTGASTGWMDDTTGLSNGVSDPTQLISLANSLYTGSTSLKNRDAYRMQAASLWGNNLLTGDNGVQPQLFPGVDTTGNNAHCTIEPPNTSSSANAAVESVKFSNLANLYIKASLSAPAAGVKPAVTWSFYTQDPAGGLVALNVPTNVSAGNGVVKFNPYHAVKTTVGTKVKSGANANKYPITTQEVTSTGAGTTATVYSATLPSDTKSDGTTWSGAGTDTKVDGGLYDQRRNIGIDLVEMDMKKLSTTVDNMKNSTSDGDTVLKTDSSLFTNWNGVVYVQIADSSSRGGTSQQSGSLRLINGEVSSGSLMPDYNPNYEDPSVLNGLTVATNAPVYILGNFNADGAVDTTVSTNTYINQSASQPDDFSKGVVSSITNSKETPMLIAGDAVTVLSKDWKDASSYSVNKPNTNNPVEVSAALWVGNVGTASTNSPNASSGGAHNLIRFLENWRNPVAVRGSLLCMFQSTLAVQPWSTAYYGAPTRIWGLNTLFTVGGRCPPGCFRPKSFRRVGFKALPTESDYNAVKNSL
jgi:hypothetical protein